MSAESIAENVKQMLSTIVPFVKTVGLTIDEVGQGSSVASLASTPPVHNHLGTVHAGALYTVGESATGAVVLGMFLDLVPVNKAFIALKTATVTHTRARPGDLKAAATLKGDPASVRAEFDREGKVDFDVGVVFTVDGTGVAEATYTWAARTPR